jgi:CheY-like chemotaxis protein
MTYRILIIDDDEGVRDAFTLALDDQPELEVTAVPDGLQGIEAAAAARPDLVFLDLNMPGINGVQTMTRLLQQDASLRIYIVTAFHQEFMQDLKQAQAVGLNFELARKPLNADQIRRIVRGVLFGESDEPPEGGA